jgi:serine/threonine protein kinase
MCDLDQYIKPGTDLGKELNIKLLEKYKVVKLLGVGGFGKVYKIEKIDDPNKYYALKVIDLTNEHNQQKFLKEKSILKKFTKFSLFQKSGKCNHPNINCHLDVIHTDACGYILTNYFNTDLEKDIKVNKGFKFRALKNIKYLSQYVKWIQNLASSITYIHSKLLAHGDLKPGNILINTDKDYLAITDFDTLCIINIKNEFCNLTDLTDIYASPELFDIMGDKKARTHVPVEIIQTSDYWALCIIILELWLGNDELMTLLTIGLPTPFFAADFYKYIEKNKDFFNKLKISAVKMAINGVPKNIEIQITPVLNLLLQAIILMERISAKKAQKGDFYVLLKTINDLVVDNSTMAGGVVSLKDKYYYYKNKYLETKHRLFLNEF